MLSCWSLLTSDRELTVVNLRGAIPPLAEPGSWEAVIGVSDPAERARLRIAEDARALARAGRKPVNLALLDAKHEPRLPELARLAELDRALIAEVPSASRVYVPAAIGGHLDHRLARRYGRMLLRAGMPVVLYADLPYCIFHGWPPWVDGGEPAANRNVDAYWQSFLSGVPELPPLRSAEVERLGEQTASAKREALLSYEASLNFAVRHMLADLGFHAFEVRWELVGPTATAGASERLESGLSRAAGGR